RSPESRDHHWAAATLKGDASEPLRVAVLALFAAKPGRRVIIQPGTALDVDRLALYLTSHRHRNQVVPGASQRRRATTKSATGRITAPGNPDKLGNLSQESRIDRRFTGSCAGSCSGTTRGARRTRCRRLRRTSDEPVTRRTAAAETSKAAAAAQKLRLDARQLRGVAASLRHRVDHEVDALHVRNAVTMLRGRKRLRLGLRAEVPVRPIDACTGGTRSVHDRNGVSARARHRELHRVAHTGRNTVRELRAVRHARPLEGLLSNLLTFHGRLTILERGGRRKEVRTGSARIGILHLLERCNVHDPYAASVSARDQFVIARL